MYKKIAVQKVINTSVYRVSVIMYIILIKF